MGRAWLVLLMAACGVPPTERPRPAPTAPDAPARESASELRVAIGGTRICVLRDGRVLCRDGESFEPVGAIDEATAIAVAREGACAIRRDGSVWCWGSIGGAPQAAPRRVEGADGASLVALSEVQGCAASDGAVVCWGSALRAAPALQRARAVELVGGGRRTCARTGEGAVWCWGASDEAPIHVEEAQGATAIAATQTHACALDRAGRVVCWGDSPPDAFDVPGGIALGVGRRHTCVLRRDRGVTCAGRAEGGELGDGRALSDGRADVVGIAGARALAVGDHSACAVVDEVIRCWGRTPQGETWDDPGFRPVAVELGGLPGGPLRGRTHPGEVLDPAALPAGPEPSGLRVGAGLAEASMLVAVAYRADVIAVDAPARDVRVELASGDAAAAVEAVASAAGLAARRWGRVFAIGSEERLARADALPARALPSSRRMDLLLVDAQAPELLRLLGTVGGWRARGTDLAGSVSAAVRDAGAGEIAGALLRLGGCSVSVARRDVEVGSCDPFPESTVRRSSCGSPEVRAVDLGCHPIASVRLGGVALVRDSPMALLVADGSAAVVRPGGYVGRSIDGADGSRSNWRVGAIVADAVILTLGDPPARAVRLALAGPGPVAFGPF